MDRRRSSHLVAELPARRRGGDERIVDEEAERGAVVGRDDRVPAVGLHRLRREQHPRLRLAPGERAAVRVEAEPVFAAQPGIKFGN